jgi:hypothetical protein
VQIHEDYAEAKMTMITIDEAMALVQAEISKENLYEPDLVLEILESATLGKEWGWVFFYDSAEHIRTGDDNDAIAGNAPFIVNRDSGELVVTGTAWPIEKYIEDYETRLLSGA